MAGPQGSGKSTVAEALARALPAVLLSVDPLESGMYRAGIGPSFERGHAAYLVAEEAARANLRLGHHVVVDAANYVTVARRTWTALGAEEGVPVRFVDVSCADRGVHRARIEGRRRDLAGIPEVTWADVERRAAETEPWGDEPRIVVDTSAGFDVAGVLAALRAEG